MVYKVTGFFVALLLISAGGFYLLQLSNSRPVVAPNVVSTTPPTALPQPSAPTSASPSVVAPTTSPPESPVTAKPAAGPQSSSSGYIEARIKARLDAKSGMSTRIVCPERVPLVEGARVSCAIYHGRTGQRLNTAIVTIRSAAGDFTWVS